MREGVAGPHWQPGALAFIWLLTGFMLAFMAPGLLHAQDVPPKQADAASAPSSPGTENTRQSEAAFIREATRLFSINDYPAAQQRFTEALTLFPDNPLPLYFLGEIALQENQIEEAAKHWRTFVEKDPGGAQELRVPQRLTILEDNLLTSQYKVMLANEEKFSNQPPEPNSIAVMPLSNDSDPSYNILAKGMTAMIISDLAKVPGLKVLERGQVQKLVDEMALSESGLTGDYQTRAGKLLKAERLITGTYGIQK